MMFIKAAALLFTIFAVASFTVIQSAPTSQPKLSFFAAIRAVNTTPLGNGTANVQLSRNENNTPILAIERDLLRNLTKIISSGNGSNNEFELRVKDSDTGQGSANDRPNKPAARPRNNGNGTANASIIDYASRAASSAFAKTHEALKKYDKPAAPEYGYCEQRIRPRKHGLRKTYEERENVEYPNRRQAYKDAFGLFREPEIDTPYDDENVRQLISGSPTIDELLDLFKIYKQYKPVDYKKASGFFDRNNEDEDERQMSSTIEFFV